MNVVDHGMQVEEAVNMPRIHHQWLPDTIYAEPFALSPDTAQLLGAMGHGITEQMPWGAVEAILVGTPDATGATAASSGDDSTHGGGLRPGALYGVNDARRPAGAAIGY